jgi:2-polyprenyl-3-methyl-5-hydroxy-6-metoxy-1,4-benzoquinol methylase
MVTESERDSVREFFADPRPYLRNNPYVALRAEAARRLLPLRANVSIIDLGCGDGRISIPLVQQSGALTLVDASQRMLDLARRIVPPEASDRVRLECVDLGDFKTTETFDIVLCVGVLAHVSNVGATLRQVASLVATGGCALVQITDDSYRLARITHGAGALTRRLRGPSTHALNHMTLESIREQMQGLGLALTDAHRYVFVPGLRRLPPIVTRAIVRAVNGPALARRGGEVLALFSRK